MYEKAKAPIAKPRSSLGTMTVFSLVAEFKAQVMTVPGNDLSVCPWELCRSHEKPVRKSIADDSVSEDVLRATCNTAHG